MKEMYFPVFDCGIGRKICSHRIQCLVRNVRWYVRVSGVYIGVKCQGCSSRALRAALGLERATPKSCVCVVVWGMKLGLEERGIILIIYFNIISRS